MNMTTFSNKTLRVGRNATEYIAPTIMIFVCFLNFIIYAFFETHMKYRLFFVFAWLVLLLVYGVVFIYKLAVPILRADGRFIVVFPRIFKKTTIDPQEVKTVRVYKYNKRTIITQKQLKQNNTILIEYKNGDVLTLRHLLPESIRNKIYLFLQNFHLNLEVIEPEH